MTQAVASRTITTLAGGAMFGNPPRALWQCWMVPDEMNRIDLGCRVMLVQEPDRNVLVEAGIGAFFSPEQKGRYDRFPEMLIDEKSQVLESLLGRNGRLVFTRDPLIAMGRLSKDAKGEFGLCESSASPAQTLPAWPVDAAGIFAIAAMAHSRGGRATFCRSDKRLHRRDRRHIF